jgi:hypothetical protein
MACPGCSPGEPAAPECIDGTWVCPDVSCADAAVSCPRGLVPTAEGCLACAEITDHIGSVIDALLSTSTACNTVDDCTYGAMSTTCAGACPVAVAKNEQAAFEATVDLLSEDYCQDFVATCGYTTPKCAVASLGCVNGACALVPN